MRHSEMKMPSRIAAPRRILIVKLSAIGDVVMATPVAKALRTAYPSSYIAWVVESKSRDVVTGNPYLDEVIVWDRHSAGSGNVPKPFAFLAGLRELGRKLRERNFDVAIDCQGLLRSAVVARISGARYRLGYDNAREGAALLYNMRLPTNGSRLRGPWLYLDMLSLLDIKPGDAEMCMPLGDEDRAFAREFIAKHSRSCTKLIAMCPATTRPQKHWTERGWAKLASALVQEYDALPIFLGSSADIQLIERISALVGDGVASAAGKTTLKQAAAIVECSDLVVAVDTGLMHISLAMNRPTVGIFGPTGWDHFLRGNLIPVAKDLGCGPCMRHPSCEDFDCMQAITADDILKAVDGAIDGR